MSKTVILTCVLAGWLSVCSSSYALTSQDLKNVGMHHNLSKIVDEGCDKHKDPNHCKVFAASISNAESGMGKASTNAFGFTDGKYTSHEAAFKRWYKSYTKYWYKAKDPSWFYAERGKVPKTHYCMSEHSSNSKLGCPNGRKNAFVVFNKLKHALQRGKEEGGKVGVVRPVPSRTKQVPAATLPRPAKPERASSGRPQSQAMAKFLKAKF